MKKVRKKGQKRCNRYGYIASFKNCPLEHSEKASFLFFEQACEVIVNKEEVRKKDVCIANVFLTVDKPEISHDSEGLGEEGSPNKIGGAIALPLRKCRF